MHLGLPDLGFMDLSQVADHVMAIRCVIDLPLIVDIDTGFWQRGQRHPHGSAFWSKLAPVRFKSRTSMRPNGAVTSTARS